MPGSASPAFARHRIHPRARETRHSGPNQATRVSSPDPGGRDSGADPPIGHAVCFLRGCYPWKSSSTASDRCAFYLFQPSNGYQATYQPRPTETADLPEDTTTLKAPHAIALTRAMLLCGAFFCRPTLVTSEQADPAESLRPRLGNQIRFGRKAPRENRLVSGGSWRHAALRPDAGNGVARRASPARHVPRFAEPRYGRSAPARDRNLVPAVRAEVLGLGVVRLEAVGVGAGATDVRALEDTRAAAD